MDERGRRPVAVPPSLDVLAAWGWRVIVVAAAAAVVSVALIQLYVVVVPVVLALFLAAALEPPVSWLTARRWPRALAAVAVFMGSLAVLVGLLAWIGANVAEEFGAVGDQLNEAVTDAKDWLQGDPFNLTAERVEELESDLRAATRTAAGGFGERAARGARAAGEALGGLVLMLFTLFFVLKDGARMATWFGSRVPAGRRDDVSPSPAGPGPSCASTSSPPG